MSAPKGIQLESSASDVVEISALRGRQADLTSIARERGISLCGLGRASVTAEHVVLSVRPDRWLLLTPPAVPGKSAKDWQRACAGIAVAADLSSGLTAFEMAGAEVRNVLARGCRLDLDTQLFPPGHAAATIMAQVSVILVNLDSAMLLLTPSTTARHFREWLMAAAKPFGLAPCEDRPS